MDYDRFLENENAKYTSTIFYDGISKDCFRCCNSIFEGDDYYNINVNGKERVYCCECVEDSDCLEEDLEYIAQENYDNNEKIDELFQIEKQLNEGLVKETL